MKVCSIELEQIFWDNQTVSFFNSAAGVYTVKKSSLHPTALKVDVVSGDIRFQFETRQFNVSDAIRVELAQRGINWVCATYWIGNSPNSGTLYH